MGGSAALFLAIAASGQTASAPPAPVPPAVQVFKAACIDGSARISRATAIRGGDLASGGRGALYRATRLHYYIDKPPPPAFRDYGSIFRTSERPLTYLLPQVATDPSQSARPACVVLTREDVSWPAQVAVRRWVKPGEIQPVMPPGPKVGSKYKSGFVTDRTFEARLGHNSVAVFRHAGWTVMRTLDHTGRPHPYEQHTPRQ